MKTVWLNEMTWQEVEEYLKRSDVVLVPAGSTEQHGPAGPLGLDTYAAIALVEDAAAKTGVVVTPPIWFGDSAHHLGFPGTISIRTETLIAYVSDVLRSLAGGGFRKILIVNGHRGANLPALHTAAANLKEFELPDVFFAVIDPLGIAGEAAELRESKEHHAGEMEMSHVMYKFPDLIRKDRIPHVDVDMEGRYSKYIKSDLFAGGVKMDILISSAEERELAPTGAYCDATKANAEKGKQLHDQMVAEIVTLIEWLREKQQ